MINFQFADDFILNDVTFYNKETTHLRIFTAFDIAPKYVIANGIPTSMVSRLYIKRYVNICSNF